MSETADRLVAALEDRAAARAPAEPDWLTSLRRDAIDRFAELGIPGPRDEEWKHNSARRLLSRDLVPAAPPARTDVPAALPRIDGAIPVVLVDGRLVAAPADLPDGVRVRGLLRALREARDGVPAWLGRVAGVESRSLTALNAASLADGVLVEIDRDAILDRPLHLLHHSTGDASGRSLSLRNVVLAGPGSRAEIVEHFTGAGDATALVNAVTEVAVDPGAQVTLVKLQEEAVGTDHVALVSAVVERDARFVHRSVAVGAATGRTETRVKLAGEGAVTDLSGVSLARGEQVADQLTLVSHAVPNGTSRQVYRSILDERARGIFNGLVVVRPGAQRTAAEQTSRNLVLAESATAHARPQLDISADDVKCSHGATVGALDPQALFYLRSRGIGPAEARRLLVRAFATDVLAAIGEGPVRDHAERLVSGWLER